MFDKRIDDRLERTYIAPARSRYGRAAWTIAERAGAALAHAEATAYALQQARQSWRPHTEWRPASGIRLSADPAGIADR